MLIQQASVGRVPSPGRWLVAWRIQNLDQQPLQILAGRLPHGKFRGDEKEFTPVPRLSRNESAKVEFTVACSEAPGAVIENAFLILRLLRLETVWWVFARLRVTTDEKGAPHAITELITTKPTGFSRE